jgi:hypothetical protein
LHSKEIHWIKLGQFVFKNYFSTNHELLHFLDQFKKIVEAQHRPRCSQGGVEGGGVLSVFNWHNLITPDPSSRPITLALGKMLHFLCGSDKRKHYSITVSDKP